MIKIEKQSVFQFNVWFWMFYILSVAAGCFLRLYLISDQVVLDDEWHALNFSLNHSLSHILTHFSYAGANIIPINAYARLLLVTSGWSEIPLILPSIIAGIASLIVFPLILKRFFNNRITIFFAFLFAFSPLVIFYSRVCRPYSIYTFLGFSCIWVLYEWAITGEKKFGLMFAFIGILCVYFHFVGILFVFVPLFCVVIVKLMLGFSNLPAIRERILPSFSELVSIGCVILIGLIILLAVAIIQRHSAVNLSPARFTIQSILGFMIILSGTYNVYLNILFYALFGIGLVRLFRESFLLGFIYIIVFIAYVFISIIIKSNFAHVPIVLSRYIIPAFPMSYLLIALGLDTLWKKISILPANKIITNFLYYGAIGCFLFGLLWTGPLRQTYVVPNNFTSHSAFQESYMPMSWDQPRISDMIQMPYAINDKNMSAFYKTLAAKPNVTKIIEYPMPLGNHFNLLYYYQRFHKKKVIVGYTLSIKDSTKNPQNGVVGNMIVDQVLSQVKDPSKLKFQNMVNILDMAAVKKCSAELIVFHKNTESEVFEQKNDNNISEIPLITAITHLYQKIFGKPVFEDKYLIVFKI